MASYKLYLFGSPRLERNGQPLVIHLRKALALFIYLVVTRQPHSRDALATLFWPEKDQQGARANLRRTLYDLSQLLGEQPLTIAAETIALPATTALWVDSEAFQRCLADHLPADSMADKMNGDPLPALIEAADCYTDDFLAGFTLPDCPAFDDWQFFQREELRSAYARLLQQLVALYIAQEKFDEAVRYVRRWLLLDPLEESVHRQLMRLYAQTGQWAAAIRQYEECMRILEAELGMPPEAETTALSEAIRARRFPAPDKQTGRREEQIRREGEGEKGKPPGQERQAQGAVAAFPPPVSLPASLPTPSTPFLGRAQELADLLHRLQDPACRLLTLIGPGGIGKTRLALRVAQISAGDLQQAIPRSTLSIPHFSDGVFFVPLQPVDAVSGFISAIAEAVGFRFYSDIPPHQQLFNFLAEKQMLLVLDNLEHLPEGGDLIAELLTKAPKLKLLATSQRSLNLHEEWFHPLAGMALPHRTDPASHFSPLHTAGIADAQTDAVQFFIHCAHRARVDFVWEVEQEQVARICRLVDGLPLALELAAAWLKVLSCQQIADEIERSLDILTTRHGNMPVRHRSMQAVLAQSWQQMLDETERTVLKRLAIFRGGFTQEAALDVANASFLTLATLVEKALVWVTPTSRYQMHELLRQYAAAQWTGEPTAEATTRQHHSRYYLAFLIAREQKLVGKEQPQALEQVTIELENIQEGWRWAVQQHDWTTIGQATEALFWFYVMRHRSAEGEKIFAQTIAHLEQSEAWQGDSALILLRAILLRKAAVFNFFLGDSAVARTRLEESLAVARRLQRPQEVAYALNVLGVLLGWQGEQAVGIAQLRECLALALALDDQQTAADVFHELGQLLAHAGEFVEAKALTLQGLALCRQLGRPDWTAHALDTLGWATFCLGEYQEAARYYRESLTIFQELDHKLGMSLALGGLGLVAWAQGGEQLPTALQVTAESLAICRAIGNRLHCANHLADLAQIAGELGDYEQALAYGQEGVAIAGAVGSLVFEAYNLCGLGSAACRMGDWAACRGYLLRAIKTAQDAHLLPALVIALFHYALLLSQESEATYTATSIQQTKQQQALALLTVISVHPACWRIYRDRAAALQAKLTAKLPPALVTAAHMAGQQQTIETLTAALLIEGFLPHS